jgi:hypothetical protein
LTWDCGLLVCNSQANCKYFSRPNYKAAPNFLPAWLYLPQ